MIKAVVFDMDGLMFDSERIVQMSWEKAGDILGYPNMGKNIYNTLGTNAIKTKAYFLEKYGEDFQYDVFRQHSREIFYAEVDKNGMPAKKGLFKLLKYLKSRDIKMAVASSSRLGYVEKNCKRAGITDYFQAMVCGAMVPVGKPAPDIYIKACEALHINPSDAMALEDSPNGIRSASSAGLKVIAVPDMIQPDEDILSLTYAKCNSLLEVIDLIEGLEHI